MAGSMGDLVIRLGLDITALRGDVGKANAEMTRFFSNVDKKMGAMETGFARIGKSLRGFGATVVAGLGISAITSAFDSIVERADAIKDMAEQLGLTTQALQELQYAAAQAGIGREEFGKGISKLGSSFIDAAKGAKAASAAFEDLGINVEALAKKGITTEELITKVSEAFEKMPDSVKKADLAKELFGKSGLKWISVFNDNLEEARKRAVELGAVMSDETLAAMEQMDKASLAVKESMGALFANVIGPMVPAIVGLTTAFAELIPWLRKTEQATKDLGGTADVIQDWGLTLAKTFGDVVQWTRGIIATINVLVELLKSASAAIVGFFVAAQRASEFEFAGAKQAVKEIGLALTASGHDIVNAYAALGEDASQQFVKSYLKSVERTRKAMATKPIPPSKIVIPTDEGEEKKKGKNKAATELEQAEKRLFALEERNKREGIELQRRTSMEELEIYLHGLEEEEKASKRLYKLEAENREEATKKAQEESEKQLEAFLDNLEKMERESERFQQIFTDNFADSLTDLVAGTKSVKEAFTDMANSITQSITRIAAQRLAESIFGTRETGGGGTGDFFMKLIGTAASSYFGGGGSTAPFMGGGGTAAPFASGGSFGAYRPMLVGERGPEIIVPSTGGTVVPNHALGSSTVNVTVNVPPVTDRRSADQMAAGVGSAVQRAMRRTQ